MSRTLTVGETFDIGDVIAITTSVRNSSGDLVDPSSITLYIKLPDDTVTTVTSGSLTNGSVGVYQYDLEITQSGYHRYRFSTEGPNTTDESAFTVRPRKVTP